MSALRHVIIILFVFCLSPLSYGQQNAQGTLRQGRHSDRSAVTALAFSQDGKVLAVGRYKSVTLRDAATGRNINTLKGIEGTVASLSFDVRATLLAVGTGIPGKDGVVELWDWKAGRRVRALTGHHDLVYAVAIRSDGRQLAAVSYDRLVSLWNLAGVASQSGKSESPRYLRDHTDSVYGLAYSPNGKMLATVAGDRTVKVWDTETGRRLFTLSDSTAELYTVAFRPDGKQLAAGGVDKTLRVWNVDANGGVLAHSAFAHEAALLRVVYSHDGKTLFTCGEDNAVKQWDADTLEEREDYPRQPDWPQSMAISPNDKLLAIGSYDGSLAIYNTQTSKTVFTARTRSAYVRSGRTVSAFPGRFSHIPVKQIPVRRIQGRNENASLATDTDDTYLRRRVAECKAEDVPADSEVKQQAENESLAKAQPVPVPCVINGTLWNGRAGSPAPNHYYRFAAKRGKTLILDVFGRRMGSPLDSEIEVLDVQGKPVERAVLRAVSQTEITLSDRDSASPGIRLLLRPEFKINDYVLAGRELDQIYALPKGPDDDYQFRSYRGQRSGFLGTTPEFHTVGGQVYKVEVHPPGSVFSPNGMPLKHIYYYNDDGGPLYGRDSYLEFTPPADGDYIVRLSDVRGQQGEKYTYRLRIHPPRPDFKISLNPASITVPKNGAAPVTVECERYEGLTGEIAVHLEGLPPGFSATEGTIEAGETSATILITIAPDAETPKPAMPASYRVVAVSMIGGKEERRVIEQDDKNRRLSIGAASKVQIVTDLRDVTLRPGEETIVEARITRENGFKNRIPLDIRNLPFGVRVVDVGLNGVLINETETSRKFTLHCDVWVKPQTRPFYVMANVEGGIPNTAPPLTLHISDGQAGTKVLPP